MTNFRRLLAVLSDGNVEFILVGGVAATVHGSARLTQDIDIVYSRSRPNIERLVQALQPLNPYLRGVPLGLPFDWSVETISRGLNFTLTTTAGDLDIFGEIAGGGTYDRLSTQAFSVDLFGHACLCVKLRELIRLKRAAGRPKDLEVLAELEVILEEQLRNPEGKE
jgi:predicted nucleotidyltransferase